MIVLGVLKCFLFHKAKWQAGLHIREASQQTKMSIFSAHGSACASWQKYARGVLPGARSASALG